MPYTTERGRRLIEDEGNLALYRDQKGIYTIDEGKKLFFKIKNTPYDDIFLNHQWDGVVVGGWDYYAVEKEDNYFKLVSRNQTDTLGHISSFDETDEAGHKFTVLFQIANFDLDGYLISVEIPTVPPVNYTNPVFWTSNSIHADRLKDLVYRFYSPLEYWLINNKNLLSEYVNSSNPGLYYVNNRNPKGRLEDWAYNKYVELYPGEQVPATYGIEGNYPSSQNAYIGKKTFTGNFRDYKFYNRGSGKYEIETDSGFDEITGMILEFYDQTIDAVDDVKGVFDQVTGKDDVTGKTFRLYNAAFARLPDASGLEYWISQRSSGANSERIVAQSFLGSAEFIDLYGEDVSHATYVNNLYKNVLGREADTAGLNYWVGNLTNGIEERHEALLGFSESAENKALFSEMTGFI